MTTPNSDQPTPDAQCGPPCFHPAGLHVDGRCNGSVPPATWGHSEYDWTACVCARTADEIRAEPYSWDRSSAPTPDAGTQFPRVLRTLRIYRNSLIGEHAFMENSLVVAEYDAAIAALRKPAAPDAPCPECGGSGTVVCSMTSANDRDCMRASWSVPCPKCAAAPDAPTPIPVDVARELIRRWNDTATHLSESNGTYDDGRAYQLRIAASDLDSMLYELDAPESRPSEASQVQREDEVAPLALLDRSGLPDGGDAWPVYEAPCIEGCAAAGPVTHTQGCHNRGKISPEEARVDGVCKNCHRAIRRASPPKNGWVHVASFVNVCPPLQAEPLEAGRG